MPKEVARVSATAIIWSAIALIYAFLLIGKSIGPFEMVLGILIAVCGLVGTAAVWEQLNDSNVHIHLAGTDTAATRGGKSKGRLDESDLQRLAQSLDDESAATLLAAIQERDETDGESFSLRRLMGEGKDS